jgi:hypothetical protein
MQFAGGGGGDASDMRGRHRIQAELKKLEQKARFLEVRQASVSALFLLSTSLIPLLICSAARVAFQKEKFTSFHVKGEKTSSLGSCRRDYYRLMANNAVIIRNVRGRLYPSYLFSPTL